MQTISFLISSLSNSGGTQRMLSLLANKLAKEYRVLIFVHNEGEPFFYLAPEIQQVVLKGNLLQKNRQLYRTLKKERVSHYIHLDSNSVLFNSFWLPSFTKLVIWEHFSLENNAKKWHFIVSRFSASIRAHQWVVLSKTEKNLWQKTYWVSKKRIKVIPNPVTIAKDKIDSSNKRHHRKVLAIGNKIKVKGFDLLLDAWKMLTTDWELCIIGLPESEQKVLAQQIDNGNIKNVSIYGRKSDMAAVYKNASLFVLSSRKEATPLVLIESQAFGLPGVAFDHLSSVKEMVADSICYADYQLKEKSLAEQINRFIQSEERYVTYHKKALQNAHRYSQARFFEEWKEILETQTS